MIDVAKSGIVTKDLTLGVSVGKTAILVAITLPEASNFDNANKSAASLASIASQYCGERNLPITFVIGSKGMKPEELLSAIMTGAVGKKSEVSVIAGQDFAEAITLHRYDSALTIGREASGATIPHRAHAFELEQILSESLRPKPEAFSLELTIVSQGETPRIEQVLKFPSENVAKICCAAFENNGIAAPLLGEIHSLVAAKVKAAGSRPFEIDLSGVKNGGAEFIGVLLDLKELAKKSGGSIRFTNLDLSSKFGKTVEYLNADINAVA